LLWNQKRTARICVPSNVSFAVMMLAEGNLVAIARCRPSETQVKARKLNTYQTSLGFFEQAIAATSMKAALAAWGADRNLFRQGAAKEATDPDVIAAAMMGLSASTPNCRRTSARMEGRRTDKIQPSRRGKLPFRWTATDRKASQAYEWEHQRRERNEATEEAARQKERARRQQAVDKAQAAMVAEEEHAQRAAALRDEIETIETRLKAEKYRLGKRGAAEKAACGGGGT
jgi:hypothetical protein